MHRPHLHACGRRPEGRQTRAPRQSQHEAGAALPRKWHAERMALIQGDKYVRQPGHFIDVQTIETLLAEQRPPENQRVHDILQKSLAVQTLTPEEAACLMRVDDPDLWQYMCETAGAVKRKVYDNRIVTFAPFYVGNCCVNNCSYCGFKRSNREVVRKVLSPKEIEADIRVLADQMGHKRLIAVYGEHPATGVEQMVESLKTIYGVQVKTRTGRMANIRRVNVNAPPMPINELERLKTAGLGTYQVFQETYHPGIYGHMHPPGTLKGNYQWRLYCMHRAMEAGIDDVGIGALFGLGPWRFEVLGLLSHAHELERAFGIGPHTVSFPRLVPALHCGHNRINPHRVSDEDFMRLVTVLRLAIPYTGMIITAREGPEIRRRAIPLGCTQTDASPRIAPGGYIRDTEQQQPQDQQFFLGDTRGLDEVIRDLAGLGCITSFCTAGYRCGRTGEKIMDMLRTGHEGMFCKLNAVLTFREWVDDFGSEETRAATRGLVQREVEDIRRRYPRLYPSFMKYYKRIGQGEHDLFF